METRRTLENFFFFQIIFDSEESKNDTSLACFLFAHFTSYLFALLLPLASDADVFNKIFRKLRFSKNSTRGDQARFS